MSGSKVPARVRAYVYAYRTGMVLGGLGILGFVLSFWEVGSKAAAAVDVHEEVPVLAYASIAVWAVGLVVMWFSRRRLTAAASVKADESNCSVSCEERRRHGTL